jgi:hypothetical protein
VPSSVLGSTYYKADPEPRWRKLEEVPVVSFVRGLRERNWTSSEYNASAPKWKIQLWTDSGRFLYPAFNGFRALVEEDGGRTFWVDCSHAGLPTFLESRLGGAGFGTPFSCGPYLCHFSCHFSGTLDSHSRRHSQAQCSHWQSKSAQAHLAVVFAAVELAMIDLHAAGIGGA